ncbi:hypothetical protein LBMAG49_15410 [Planctomycetota bacterium]|nr:hypothetical protein LBMAG49_15410 [Planctomycetota bacterium]
MGLYFRRSIGIGPFRINLSRSGVGYSVGSRGFRMGVDGRGRKYTNLSIPNTGIGYRGKGCLVLILSAITFATTGSLLWQATT